VGIGTSSPVGKLHVNGGSFDSLTVSGNSTNSVAARFQNSAASSKNYNIGSSGGGVGAAGSFFIYDDTAAAARLVIDTSGNVGIGTSSPGTYGRLVVKQSADTGLGALGFVSQASTTDTYLGIGYSSVSDTCRINASFISTGSFKPLTFFTSDTERMRIDSSGNLLVGTTSAASGGKVVINQGSGYLLTATGGTLTGSQAWRHWLGSGGTSSYYIINDANTGVYLAYGGTSWTANSDERLKDIIEPIADAANKVSSLRAVIGKYKTDKEGTRRSFLIAQDVQAVLPEAVSVGIDDMLGIQYTEVIPLLVAAIKEQQTIITALTARVAALESN
jgi:hypothetical protein